MPSAAAPSLEGRLDELLNLQASRDVEPDPFHILNITRTESPYTHFFGWLLNPIAAHPWREEFLLAILKASKQILPPPGPVTFFVESHTFAKEPGDSLGFTCPDIVALAPDAKRPTWCLVLENKFDSKEGRAAEKASQCATYQKRAKAAYGDIEYSFLFSTKTGERALGETDFAAISYKQLAGVVEQVRKQLQDTGKWSTPQNSDSERFAYYLVDAFLRHIKLTLPDEDVRKALKGVTRKQPVAGISQSWIDSRADVLQAAAALEATIDRWDLDTMVSQIRSSGATDDEVAALEAIYQWGQEFGVVDFQASQTSSFVIRIPTSGSEVRILTVQGRKLRFYWGHFVGGYDETKRPNLQVQKFPRAYELAELYCQKLNLAFGWDFKVIREKDGSFVGFFEPSCPLKDVASPDALQRFLQILSWVAAEAKGKVATRI